MYYRQNAHSLGEHLEGAANVEYGGPIFYEDHGEEIQCQKENEDEDEEPEQCHDEKLEGCNILMCDAIDVENNRRVLFGMLDPKVRAALIELELEGDDDEWDISFLLINKESVN